MVGHFAIEKIGKLAASVIIEGKMEVRSAVVGRIKLVVELPSTKAEHIVLAETVCRRKRAAYDINVDHYQRILPLEACSERLGPGHAQLMSVHGSHHYPLPASARQSAGNLEHCGNPRCIGIRSGIQSASLASDPIEICHKQDITGTGTWYFPYDVAAYAAHGAEGLGPWRKALLLHTLENITECLEIAPGAELPAVAGSAGKEFHVLAHTPLRLIYRNRITDIEIRIGAQGILRMRQRINPHLRNAWKRILPDAAYRPPYPAGRYCRRKNRQQKYFTRKFQMGTNNVTFAKLVKKFLATIIILLSAAAISSAQWDRDVFEWRGRSALQEGKYATAIENFNVLTRLDTTDYWSFFYRGIAKYNLGDIRGAHQDFSTSVRLNPVFTNGYHYRAITLSREGDYDGSLKDMQHAIELRPGFAGLYFSRGVTYFLAQRFEDAVSDFDRYIKKEPKDPSAYLNRGASYLFLGDTLKALDDYDLAIKLDRYEPEGYLRRSRLSAATGNYQAAISDINQAIQLDTANTFAYFNRALMYYETKDFNAAMADLNRVLAQEPGNALTLYNRSLISAQVGDFGSALEDMDRVININPGNVLAYFNRASFFIEMGRYKDAVADYSKAIELYPDFAKAYLNRSYVENLLGHTRESKKDYETAQQKVREYRNATSDGSFADTTKQYSSLIALDGEFAKKDFNDELLQHRDIDIRLKPFFKFALCPERESETVLRHKFEHAVLDRFISGSPSPIEICSEPEGYDFARVTGTSAEDYFVRGLLDVQNKQYNSALEYFNKAADAAPAAEKDRYRSLYKAFYLLNRGVLKAEMIDFIASIESNVQTLTMDDQGATRARVGDRVGREYDYSDAIADILAAASIMPDIPYIHFDLGNLYCLSSQLVESMESYSRAINLYPYMGEAYYNRGLVLIFLKDKEKGCIDLSRAGELGISDSYSVINKYCKEDD